MSPPDRRQLRRYVQRIPIRFSSGSIKGSGYLRNLSKQGMFVRCDRLPQPRSEIQLVIETPEGDKLELGCRVMWTTAELPNAKEVSPGFGVTIEEGHASFREFYERLLLS